MVDDDNEQSPMEAGLEAVQYGPQIIIEELRLMAAGKGQYQRFTYISPWIKNIWNAAADIIESAYKDKLH